MDFLSDLATNASAQGIGVLIYSGNDDSLVSHFSSEGRINLMYLNVSLIIRSCTPVVIQVICFVHPDVCAHKLPLDRTLRLAGYKASLGGRQLLGSTITGSLPVSFTKSGTGRMYSLKALATLCRSNSQAGFVDAKIILWLL